MLKYINANQKNFKRNLELILDKRKIIQKNKSNEVKPIIENIKKNGDRDLIRYEKKFSKIKNKKKFKIKFSTKEIKKNCKKYWSKIKKINRPSLWKNKEIS